MGGFLNFDTHGDDEYTFDSPGTGIIDNALGQFSMSTMNEPSTPSPFLDFHLDTPQMDTRPQSGGSSRNSLSGSLSSNRTPHSASSRTTFPSCEPMSDGSDMKQEDMDRYIHTDINQDDNTSLATLAPPAATPDDSPQAFSTAHGSPSSSFSPAAVQEEGLPLRGRPLSGTSMFAFDGGFDADFMASTKYRLMMSTRTCWALTP